MNPIGRINKMYCIVWHRNRLVAQVRRRYFLSAEKRRPKIRLPSRATFTSPFLEICLATLNTWRTNKTGLAVPCSWTINHFPYRVDSNVCLLIAVWGLKRTNVKSSSSLTNGYQMLFLGVENYENVWEERYQWPTHYSSSTHKSVTSNCGLSWKKLA